MFVNIEFKSTDCEINKMNIEQEVCDLYELLDVLCSIPKNKRNISNNK